MIIDLQEERTVKEIAEMAKGKAFGGGIIKSISIDSREVAENTLFIAVKGENTDGHKYIGKAVENGASCVLCERGFENIGVPYIQVENSMKALENIASSSLKKYNPFTVGVTGSVGKTSTKEFVYSVLREKYNTLKSGGNFNTIYGLSLTAASISKSVGAAVFEMGMCKLGEISQMTNCANINAGIITNIGTAHLEALGSRENIAKAKLEITEGIRKNGVLIYNADEPLLLNSLPENIRCIGFAVDNKNSDIFAENISVFNGKTTFDMTFKGEKYNNIELPVTGKHNVYNAMAAFCVGVEAGLTESEIRKGLLAYQTTGMRQRIYENGGVTFIEDCYNASPESMKASLEVLSEIGKGKRKIAVLGDMRELGKDSPKLHFSVGEYAAKHGVDILLTFGKDALDIADGALKNGMKKENVISFDNTEDVNRIAKCIKEKEKKGDTVLFKASRAVSLERVINLLKNGGENI